MSISIKVFTSPNAKVNHHRLGAQHFMGIEWTQPGSSLENEILWQKAREYAQKHSIKQWLLDRSRVSVYIPHTTWMHKSWLPSLLEVEYIPNKFGIVMADHLFCQLLLNETNTIFKSDEAYQIGLFQAKKRSKDWLLSADVPREKEILLAS
ncbi:hypothetical protein BKI52_37620 [marine bacterium AO1-C]|nr:hypothetical protein BKI52_37620 [marine bacterium AO1-C]